jgi:hypothetical protein
VTEQPKRRGRRPKAVVAAPLEPVQPQAIKMLQNVTIAWGSGLITFRDGTIYRDPIVINAAIACDLKFTEDVSDGAPGAV